MLQRVSMDFKPRIIFHSLNFAAGRFTITCGIKFATVSNIEENTPLSSFSHLFANKPLEINKMLPLY